MREFEIGERVTVANDYFNYDMLPSPPIGIVVDNYTSMESVGIQFDQPFYGGHNCRGHCLEGRGRYIGIAYIVRHTTTFEILL